MGQGTSHLSQQYYFHYDYGHNYYEFADFEKAQAIADELARIHIQICKR